MKNLILLALVVLPFTGLAHSGRTDANRCHTENKTGDYHCHSEGVAEKVAKTESRTGARISSRDYNCSDFATHLEAQETYERAGGSLVDPYDLDRDNDGIACEDLN